MRILRSFMLVVLLIVPLALMPSNANAQVAVGIGIGPVVDYPAPVYVAGPPVCEWGYYPYYPYACAPYGYYGPSWFVGGVFIGAGPWYHGWYGHPWGYGWRHTGWYGYHGGYGYHGYNGYRGAYNGARPMPYGGRTAFRGYSGLHSTGYANGFRGGSVGGFHGGGMGGFHGGGHR
jgi:hypothetical protein